MHGKASYGMVWHPMAWHGMGYYGMARYGMAMHGKVPYGMVLHSMTCHIMAWHRMAWCVTVWLYGLVWHYGRVLCLVWYRTVCAYVCVRSFCMQPQFLSTGLEIIGDIPGGSLPSFLPVFSRWTWQDVRGSLPLSATIALIGTGCAVDRSKTAMSDLTGTNSAGKRKWQKNNQKPPHALLMWQYKGQPQSSVISQ